MSRVQAATNRILRLPSPGGRLKKKTPEQLDGQAVLFGRSRTLCKFCGRVSGYPLNASIQ
jgi:hypothetical protein